ncbi:MAG: hypothetical protein V1809_10330 [Planctomycetota bacterium]
MNTRLTHILKAVAESSRSSGPDSGRIAFGNGRFAIRVAGDLESRKKAYRLVYQLYREKGYARHDLSGMWVSIHDAAPETATLLVERLSDGAAVGAITVVFDSPLGLPADNAYAGELNPLRAAGRRLAEVVSLGVTEGVDAGREILVKLFDYAHLLSREIRGATDFVITVNPRHVRFYEKTLLCEKAGPERAYGKVGGAPAVLLRLALSTSDWARAGGKSSEGTVSPKPRTLYPLAHPESEEPAILASLRRDIRPLHTEEFIRLFLEETDVWTKADPGQRAHLRARYAGWRRTETDARTPEGIPPVTTREIR